MPGLSTLRERVYGALHNDSALLELLGAPGMVFPNFAPDSPPGEVWMVLRWSTSEPGVKSNGTAKTITLQIWAYNRRKDFEVIDSLLNRSRLLMFQLEGTTGDGISVVGVIWEGASDDLRDDVYDAVTRRESYRIAASGI